MEKLANIYTPADLYPAFGQCLVQSNYTDAVAIAMVAGAYARFDTLRVADKTAHDAGKLLFIKAAAGSTEEQKKAFQQKMLETTKNPETLKVACAQIEKIGPPDYVPNYMMKHGMSAFTGQAGGLVEGFDAKAAWKSTLDTYLHCPLAGSAATSGGVFQFQGQDYVLRQATDMTFTFTPTDQTDVARRTDALVVIVYHNVNSFEQLQAQKNRVLEGYRKPGAVVLEKSLKDTPPSAGSSGECVFAAAQRIGDYQDALFARFFLQDGIGYAYVYTRSFYDGVSPEGALLKWINSHGFETLDAMQNLKLVLNDTVLATWKKSVPESGK